MLEQVEVFVVIGLEGRSRDCLSDFQLRASGLTSRMTSQQARASQ
jgi:hypothetical protein